MYKFDCPYGKALQIIANDFGIVSCKNVFLNGSIFSLHKDRQLVFGYYGGIREDIER